MGEGWNSSFKISLEHPVARCCGLNVCVPPQFIHWNWILNVMVFWSKAFRRWLGLRGGTLMNEISVLVRRDERANSFSSAPTEDTSRIWPTANQEESPHQNLTITAPWSQASSFQNHEKSMFVVLATQSTEICYSHPSWLPHWTSQQTLQPVSLCLY